MNNNTLKLINEWLQHKNGHGVIPFNELTIILERRWLSKLDGKYKIEYSIPELEIFEQNLDDNKIGVTDNIISFIENYISHDTD